MKSPKDKMIRTSDETTKALGEEVKQEKKLHEFFYPTLQRSVLAESQEEADKIINNEQGK